jgi:hypothetical protein
LARLARERLRDGGLDFRCCHAEVVLPAICIRAAGIFRRLASKGGQAATNGVVVALAAKARVAVGVGLAAGLGATPDGLTALADGTHATVRIREATVGAVRHGIPHRIANVAIAVWLFCAVCVGLTISDG